MGDRQNVDMEHPDPHSYTPLRHSIERMFGSEYLPGRVALDRG
jgi:hypothetical protein